MYVRGSTFLLVNAIVDKMIDISNCIFVICYLPLSLFFGDAMLLLRARSPVFRPIYYPALGMQVAPRRSSSMIANIGRSRTGVRERGNKG